MISKSIGLKDLYNQCHCLQKYLWYMPNGKNEVTYAITLVPENIFFYLQFLLSFGIRHFFRHSCKLSWLLHIIPRGYMKMPWLCGIKNIFSPTIKRFPPQVSFRGNFSLKICLLKIQITFMILHVTTRRSKS